MGAIAEAIASYAQPLIDQTDGSIEQLKKAFAIAQVCFNLALLDDQGREKSIGELRPGLGMDAAEFAEFRRSIIDPMIRRHEEMFPADAPANYRQAAPERTIAARLGQAGGLRR